MKAVTIFGNLSLVIFCICILITSAFGESTGFIQADTTPPTVSSPFPAPDTTTQKNTPISAKFNDNGSGVKLSSARIFLDGKDITRKTALSVSGFTYKPKPSIPKGIHRVEVFVKDKTGNKSNVLRWRFGVEVKAPLKAILKNKTLLINGEPTFPIGMYNYSCNPLSPVYKESILKQAADSGFNFMIYNDGNAKALDILAQYGMKVLLQTLFGIESSTDIQRAKEALVDNGPVKWKNHPAVLGYWADSPDAYYNSKNIAHTEIDRRMKIAYNTLKHYDPNHPVVWCYAHLDNISEYVGSGDVKMSFFYPVGQKGGFKASDISYYVINKMKAAAPEKPSWFLSQGIDLNIEYTGKLPAPKDFQPSVPEFRLMNYLALVDGVSGLGIYGSGGSKFPGISNNLADYPAQWAEAMKIGTELRFLSPDLASGKTVKKTVLQKTSAADSIRFIELEYKKIHTIIAVNQSGSDVSAIWEFPQEVRPLVLFENRKLASKSRIMPDDFKPYEVHIYRW